MGQKANPISLRLKKTNRTFDSCWYGDIHYSELLSQELVLRSFLEKIFSQILYPKPLLSFSLMAKKGKVLVLYLDPEKSRREKCDQFQLNSSKPTYRPREPWVGPYLSNLATPLSNQGEAPLLQKNLKMSTRPSTYRRMKIGDCQRNISRPFLKSGSPVQYIGIKSEEKIFFVYCLLLSILTKKKQKSSLLCDNDFTLFHKIHKMAWFQGRGNSLFSTIDENFSNFPALTTVKQGLGRGITNTSKKKTILSFKCNRNTIFLDPYKAGGLQGSRVTALQRSGSITNSINLLKKDQKKRLTKNATNTLLTHARPYSNDLTGMTSPVSDSKNKPTVDLFITRFLGSSHRVHNPFTPVEGDTFFIKQIHRRKTHFYLTFLESVIKKGLGFSTTLYPYRSVEEQQTAQFLSEEIAYYLERRVPFRRIKQLLARDKRDYINGIRVSCSGRVGGRSKKAQRSREERYQWGQTSSHVFSEKLSFAFRSGLTPLEK